MSYRESESEDEEVTKPSAATMPSAAIRPSTATRPSATTKLSADKERRATNKRIKEEVLQLMPQFKSVLTKPRGFKENHWKTLLSQMKNSGDHTKLLFFSKDHVCIDWRSHTLAKAWEILEIGIILNIKGGRALREPSAFAFSKSTIEKTKKVTYTHTLFFI